MVRKVLITRKGEKLVLASTVGNYLLGIFFHCDESGFEGDESFYSIDGALWNGWFTSPPFSTPKG